MEHNLWAGQSGLARAFLLVILGFVLYFAWRIVEPFFAPLAWAAILATVFYPVFQRMARALRRKELASGLACLILSVAIVLPALLVVLLLAGESVAAYKSLQHTIASGVPGKMASIQELPAYQQFLEKLDQMGLPKPDFADAAERAFQALSRYLVTSSASILSGLATFVLHFVVMLLGLYYFFLYGPGILHELLTLIPLRPEYQNEIIQKFISIVHATFTGSLVVALVQGAVGGLGFLIFGLPTPLLWGACMALVSLVPVLGTALIWGPVVIYYLLSGAIVKALLMLLYFAGVVGTVDNVLKPILIRRGVEIHTLWVFVGIIGGISVFGFLGLVLGPFLFTVLIVLLDIYKAEFGSIAVDNPGP
jgi:predicted PurR-regulated permease PerM